MYSKFNTHFKDPRINLAPVDYEVSAGRGPAYQMLEDAQAPLHKRTTPRKEKKSRQESRQKIIETMENAPTVETTRVQEPSPSMETVFILPQMTTTENHTSGTITDGPQIVDAHTISSLPTTLVGPPPLISSTDVSIGTVEDSNMPTIKQLAYHHDMSPATQHMTLTAGNTVCITAPMPYVQPNELKVMHEEATQETRREPPVVATQAVQQEPPVVETRVVERFEDISAEDAFMHELSNRAFPLQTYMTRILKVLGVVLMLYLIYFGLRSAMQFVARSSSRGPARRGGMHHEYVQANFDESMDEPLSNDYVSYKQVGVDEVAPHPAWTEAATEQSPEEFTLFGGMRDEMIDQLVDDE